MRTVRYNFVKALQNYLKTKSYHYFEYISLQHSALDKKDSETRQIRKKINFKIHIILCYLRSYRTTTNFTCGRHSLAHSPRLGLTVSELISPTVSVHMFHCAFLSKYPEIYIRKHLESENTEITENIYEIGIKNEFYMSYRK